MFTEQLNRREWKTSLRFNLPGLLKVKYELCIETKLKCDTTKDAKKKMRGEDREKQKRWAFLLVFGIIEEQESAVMIRI